MCFALKYGIWNVGQPDSSGVNSLMQSGYPPLISMVLASRGILSGSAASEFLRSDGPLLDPFLMADMEKAVRRIHLALERREKIAVFGDYDVDGVSATCLMTDFLRKLGATCVSYIPGRLEEGYGLNPIALQTLHNEGVKLIVSVDCGITALSEAQLCKKLGMDLVITDHHECKDKIPQAVAVLDPHRPDGGYPHTGLSGVGVAFKLASALCGSQTRVLEEYADMVCLGTVADVMPLRGENRLFVTRGLESLRKTKRPGLAALMRQCGCDPAALSASSVGYMLAPRINAAGRMGQIELAVELFLTEDPRRAEELAAALCELNRHRQEVESDIYREAVEMLPEGHLPSAIVLADETWHQGVAGIVASRIAEEYCCPTFLICLDGDHGKASSRSYGGFNLFASLTALSSLLENYGGHELAAGFTIHRDQIGDFRQEICRLAQEYYQDDLPRTVLEADCVIPPEMLTLNGVDGLMVLEPCGSGCPKPTLVMENLEIDRIVPVGSGRHLRLRLRSGKHIFNAIFFSATAESVSIAQGDVVDVAFTPQVNEYRGERTVQMNVVDIRPHCKAACPGDTGDYMLLCKDLLTPQAAVRLLPDRGTLSTVWRYLAAQPGGTLQEMPVCLLRKIVRRSGTPLSLSVLMTCLDIFRDVGLIDMGRFRKDITVRIIPREGKADLTASATYQRLLAVQESETE